MTVFLDVTPCSLVEMDRHFRGAFLIIALMMEAVSFSETSVNFYATTRRYNPEDSHLRSHRRENLKSYLIYGFSQLLHTNSNQMPKNIGLPTICFQNFLYLGLSIIIGKPRTRFFDPAGGGYPITIRKNIVRSSFRLNDSLQMVLPRRVIIYKLLAWKSSSVALQPGSGLGLPLRVFVMVRCVRCEVISPTINLILVILIRPPETSVTKASRHLVATQMKHGWETWPLNFADEHLMLIGFFYMP
jgi:hypothetical protein